MKITKIQCQQKNEKRYSIFIDDKFVFGISDVDLLYYKLKEFEDISEEKYNNILNEVIFVKAREMAYRYLSYKLRTCKEVRTKLSENEFGEDVIEKVVELLESYGYIDDLKYAVCYVKDRVELKGFGKSRIFQELKQRGISTEIAEKVLSEYPFDEFTDCLSHLEKKLKGKKEIDMKERQKCVDYLTRRGFGYSIISEVIKEYISDEKY